MKIAPWNERENFPSNSLALLWNVVTFKNDQNLSQDKLRLMLHNYQIQMMKNESIIKRLFFMTSTKSCKIIFRRKFSLYLDICWFFFTLCWMHFQSCFEVVHFFVAIETERRRHDCQMWKENVTKLLLVPITQSFKDLFRHGFWQIW